MSVKLCGYMFCLCNQCPRELRIGICPDANESLRLYGGPTLDRLVCRCLPIHSWPYSYHGKEQETKSQPQLTAFYNTFVKWIIRMDKNPSLLCPKVTGWTSRWCMDNNIVSLVTRHCPRTRLSSWLPVMQMLFHVIGLATWLFSCSRESR